MEIEFARNAAIVPNGACCDVFSAALWWIRCWQIGNVYRCIWNLRHYSCWIDAGIRVVARHGVKYVDIHVFKLYKYFWWIKIQILWNAKVFQYKYIEKYYKYMSNTFQIKTGHHAQHHVNFCEALISAVLCFEIKIASLRSQNLTIDKNCKTMVINSIGTSKIWKLVPKHIPCCWTSVTTEPKF